MSLILPRRIEAPVTEPVTLAQVKTHCRIDFADDDELIGELIDAAVTHLDGWSGILGRCMVSQTWRIEMEAWQVKTCLPFPDLGQVTVSYFDEANALTQLAAGDSQVRQSVGGQWVELGEWDRPVLYARTDAVRIDFVAGYGLAEDVPASIKLAIKMLVAHWYDNREAASQAGAFEDLPYGVRALLAPHRRTIL